MKVRASVKKICRNCKIIRVVMALFASFASMVDLCTSSVRAKSSG